VENAMRIIESNKFLDVDKCVGFEYFESHTSSVGSFLGEPGLINNLFADQE
jgi:hypothetical protein